MRQWAKAECMQSALADLWANHTGQSMGGFNGAKGAKPSPQWGHATPKLGLNKLQQRPSSASGIQ